MGAQSTSGIGAGLPLVKVRPAMLSERLHQVSLVDNDLSMSPLETKPLRRLPPASVQYDVRTRSSDASNAQLRASS